MIQPKAKITGSIVLICKVRLAPELYFSLFVSCAYMPFKGIEVSQREFDLCAAGEHLNENIIDMYIEPTCEFLRLFLFSNN